MPSTGARRAGLRPAQASATPSTTSAQHWPNIMQARTAMRPVDGRRVRALGMDSSPEVDRSLARGATHFVTGHNDVLEPFPSRWCCTRTSLTQKCQDIVDGIQKMDALERA